jgi:regulator of sigma E protease
VTVVLGKNPETGGALLGVSPSVEKPTLLQALLESISYIGLTFAAVLQFFNPETARQALSQSSSIIGASYIAADAARTSALNYAAIVAMLSLSLGVINIFPIPPLDGGKVAIELLERFTGRQIPRRIALSISAVGALMLLGLIAYLMYTDVVRFVLG